MTPRLLSTYPRGRLYTFPRHLPQLFPRLRRTLKRTSRTSKSPSISCARRLSPSSPRVAPTTTTSSYPPPCGLNRKTPPNRSYRTVNPRPLYRSPSVIHRSFSHRYLFLSARIQFSSAKATRPSCPSAAREKEVSSTPSLFCSSSESSHRSLLLFLPPNPPRSFSSSSLESPRSGGLSSSSSSSSSSSASSSGKKRCGDFPSLIFGDEK
mmetsp:Transcript_2075/g.6662  ORF Transcript_2075/g.6662 Transcript_2075/m.6662 type:complete len:209 (-) Transcript_2075:122-748(-)